MIKLKTIIYICIPLAFWWVRDKYEPESDNIMFYVTIFGLIVLGNFTVWVNETSD